MRAQSSVKVSSLVVVMWALMSGCSPDEPSAIVMAPEPLAPEPELTPEPRGGSGPNQLEINGIRELPPGVAVQVERSARVEYSDVVPQGPRRLVFECADGVSFAVRMSANSLDLYPPEMPVGFLSLRQVPSASGVHYVGPGGVDFRSNDDLATLEMGRERYVDCVSNPAAALWEESLPRDAAPR